MNYSIPDGLWDQIKSEVPVKESLLGRPEMDVRKCLEAIFWVLRTGAQWGSISRSVAPHITVHGKFRKWVK